MKYRWQVVGIGRFEVLLYFNESVMFTLHIYSFNGM